MSDDTTSKVLCVVCKEDIRAAARKCIHCDSFQDWRHYLNFSNTVLALLVALVSVLTVLTPILSDVFKNDISQTTVTFQGVHENLFNLIATNVGNKEGVIAEETFTLYNDAADSINFNLEPVFAQVIVHGGATQQSTARLNPLDFPRFLEWLDSKDFEKATLYVRVENQGAESWDKTFLVKDNYVETIRAYSQQSEKFRQRSERM